MDGAVIAERIKSLRHAAGMTQEDFAKALNDWGAEVSLASVKKWETGDAIPSPRYSEAIGKALGVDPREIFVGTEGRP